METIKGYIQEQPEMRFTPTGTAITNIRISESKSEDNVESHKRIIIWAGLAETANQLLEPDDFIYVKGYWKTRSWKGHDGEDHSVEEFTAKGIWKVGEDNQPKDIETLL